MTDSRVTRRSQPGAAPDPRSADHASEAGSTRPETWLDLVVQPTLENLAPVAPGAAETRLMWVAGLMVAVTLLAPTDAVLGTGEEHQRHLLAASFAAFGGVAWWTRQRPQTARLLGIASLAVGAVAGWLSAWEAWTLAIPGFVYGTLALVRWRSARPFPLPPRDPDPQPPVPSGLPVLLGRIASTIAVVLILRLYVLETRNVPTGSMQPTIMGDRPHAQGDRVLVNRFAYLARDPRRWEIAVFDFPLQPDVSFVKRVVGLPNEKVEIRDGDIWVNGALAAKPPRVQASLWQERFPRPGPLASPKPMSSSWTADEDKGWRRDGEGLKVTPRAGRAAFATFRGRLRSSDAQLSARVELADPTQSGRVLLEITSRGKTVLARVPIGAAPAPELAAAQLEVEGNPPTEVSTALGASGLVQLAVIDGRARLRVNHRLVVDVPVDVSGKGRLKLRIGAEGEATMHWRDLAVHEDLVYVTRGGQSEFDVPEGAFVVLGDNSPGSEDSRMWVASEYHLKGRTEPVIAKSQVPDPETGQMQQNVVTKNGVTTLIDVQGVHHSFPVSDRVRRKDVRMPFVFRRHLTGRASLVLWPWKVDEAGFRPRVLP